MNYKGYDIEETPFDGFSIILEMPSKDTRHIATAYTLEEAQEIVDEEVRIMTLLKKLKKERECQKQ